MSTPLGSRTLIDDFYLVAIIDEGETKVAQCMIHSHANTARPTGWKSLELSLPLFCVPDVESQVARKSYVASIHAPRTAILQLSVVVVAVTDITVEPRLIPPAGRGALMGLRSRTRFTKSKRQPKSGPF